MADPRKTPWAVLGLDPAWFASSSSASSASASSSLSPADAATRAALVRRAYRRALLQHHPDKQRDGGDGGDGTAAYYTVDDIKAAYAEISGGGSQNDARAFPPALDLAATGLEVVDLDDLPYDAAAGSWYRACRCGNARGFVFGEQDLEEELDAEAMETLVAADEADDDDDEGDPPDHPKPIPAGELLVGCQDCSLWLCVHFAAMPDDNDDDDDDEANT